MKIKELSNEEFDRRKICYARLMYGIRNRVKVVILLENHENMWNLTHIPLRKLEKKEDFPAFVNKLTFLVKYTKNSRNCIKNREHCVVPYLWAGYSRKVIEIENPNLRRPELDKRRSNTR